MFETRITALVQDGGQTQYLTIEISNSGWRILECGKLSNSKLKSRNRLVSHFLHSWRTEIALSLRQDNVLYKSIPVPEDAEPWWAEQQVEEMLSVRKGKACLNCDYKLSQKYLELFVSEGNSLQELQARLNLRADIIGWQITDLICLCGEYNKQATNPIYGYIYSVLNQLIAVSFISEIHILRTERSEEADLEDFFGEQGIGAVLLIGEPLKTLKLAHINLEEVWEVLGLEIRKEFYLCLASALSALHWKRGWLSND